MSRKFNANSIPIFLALLFVVSSCGTSYQMYTPDGRRNLMLHTFNDRAGGRTASIEFRNATTERGRNVILTPDSLRWIDEASSDLRSVPIDSLKRVVFTDHWLGLADGVFIGMGSFGAVGAILSYLISDATRLLTGIVMIITIISALIGIVPGAIIGAIVGHNLIYQFSPPND